MTFLLGGPAPGERAGETRSPRNLICAAPDRRRRGSRSSILANRQAQRCYVFCYTNAALNPPSARLATRLHFKNQAKTLAFHEPFIYLNSQPFEYKLFKD